MKASRKSFILGIVLILLFCIWTFLIQIIDVEGIGPKNSAVGFASLNGWFHGITGVNTSLYYLTDWLGLVPVFVGFFFAAIGLIQLIKRKKLFKVDCDILFLGVYYILVIFGYLIFEMIPINYRPVLINGILEASYPSSTTLLVLSVMPTLCFECEKRFENKRTVKIIYIFSGLFSGFMVFGRLFSGVHWFTDIIGAVLLSQGLYLCFKFAVLNFETER